MRLRIAALAGLALVSTACASTTATSTQISGTPRLEPAPVAAPTPAPAPAAAAAAAWTPAGKWTVGIVAQGQSMEVTVELTKLADGTWAGVIGTAQFGAIPMSKVVIEGKRMTGTFPVPTGDTGTMILNFDGDVAEGEWSMPGDGSKVSGKRN